MIPHLRARLWLAALDAASVLDLATSRLYQWILDRAAEADWKRWEHEYRGDRSDPRIWPWN